MFKYIGKRLLQFIPVFIGVTLILFVLQNVVPGDPIKLIAGEKALTPAIELQIRAANHLVTVNDEGQPVNAQGEVTTELSEAVPESMWGRYFYYLGNLLHGDLGNSYVRNMSVNDIFAQKYPYTIRLALCGILIAVSYTHLDVYKRQAAPCPCRGSAASSCRFPPRPARWPARS